eukprot:gene53684-34914_t
MKRNQTAERQEVLKDPPEWLQEEGALAPADRARQFEGVVERQKGNLRELEEAR